MPDAFEDFIRQLERKPARRPFQHLGRTVLTPPIVPVRRFSRRWFRQYWLELLVTIGLILALLAATADQIAADRQLDALKATIATQQAEIAHLQKRLSMGFWWKIPIR